MNDRQSILKQALSLPADDRAVLADQLLQSLPDHAHGVHDAEWAEEIERRLDAFDRGESRAISADEVMDRLRLRKSA